MKAQIGRALCLLLVFLPLATQAQTNPLPVPDSVFNGGGQLGGALFAPSAIETTAQGWIQNAQAAATHLFGALFLFEIFMLGMQAILFKQNNLEDFIANSTFKVFTASFFLWLISAAPTVLPTILSSFTQLGQQVTGSDSGTLGTVFGGGTALMFTYFAALDVIHKLANAEAVAGSLSLGAMASTLEQQIAPMCALLGMGIMMLGSLAVIFMTWIMIVCETCIVMCAGIVFLGFAGSRFTMPFAQGYLQYSMNVGVKLFAFWLVIAIEAQLISQLAVSSLTGLLASAAASLLGLGGFVALLPLLYPGFEFAIMAALAFSIPSIATSFTQGASAFSATDTIARSMTTIAQSSTALGNMMEQGSGGLLSYKNKRAGAPEDAPSAPVPPRMPNPAAEEMDKAVKAPRPMQGFAPTASETRIDALSTKAIFDLITQGDIKTLSPSQQNALEKAFVERPGLRQEYDRFTQQSKGKKSLAGQFKKAGIATSSGEKALLPRSDDDNGTAGMRWGS